MSHLITILLIEDNPGDARLFKEVIRESNSVTYNIQIVTSIKLARQLDVPSKQNIDIIILDLNLPDSSGIHTLLRCKEIFPKTPIVVFSGFNDESIAIEAVKSGAQDYLVKGTVDFQTISRTINYAIERHALWVQLEAAEKREHYLATRDPLTGLLNRHNLTDTLERQIQQSKRRNERMATVFLDLDRFKGINDSLGHSAGDAILVEVAQRLKNCVRITDTVARLGGDEFVLVLSNLQYQDDAARICKKVLHQLNKPIFLNDHEIHIDCSMGIAMYPEDADNFESMIKLADVAMYSAKDSGRNCYKFYSKKMTESANKRLSFENNMRAAIENESFTLVYQPIYDIKLKKLIGTEALLRWPQEDGTLLNPIDFINIAEETRLIIPLGNFVLKEACRQAKQWSDSIYPNISISVNVSACQFEQKDFVHEVNNILNETGLDANQLTLELTEHTIMSDAEIAAITLNKLKAMNIKIAIDDFGTGYSSLSYLNRFPIDTLKIDKTFIHNLENSKKDQALIEAIITLAKNLGLSITAEGVETEHQCNTIIKLGCDHIQGFHLYRPMNATKINTLSAAA